MRALTVLWTVNAFSFWQQIPFDSAVENTGVLIKNKRDGLQMLGLVS